MYRNNDDDYETIKEERLPLSIRNVDIADLLKENPTIMKDMFNGHKVHVPLYKCPDCNKTMPEEVKHIHKCPKAKKDDSNVQG